jgi:aromatic-L-amino-acid/L-tryptophan decarboxylase
MHVDAAYAGVAAICPEHRSALEGLEYADSFATNCHKWLLTNFDCTAMWVRDAEPLKQALSLTPPFLRAKGNALDYKVRPPLP